MSKQIQVGMKFTADTSQAQNAINSLKQNLQQLAYGSKPIGVDSASFEQASRAAKELSYHLNQAYNSQTGKLDLSKLDASLKSSKTSLSQLTQSFAGAGDAGKQAFVGLAQSIANAEQPAIKLNGFLGNMATTLKNTIRWQLSANLIRGFTGGIQKAFGYAKDLNESLNNIRIVTGYSTDKMADFAAEANKAAKALSTTTTAYTDAALIYYQQGLSGSDVTDRVETTVKLANVSRQSAEEVSDQMTAIWNNFYDGSRSLESYADTLTALGAATASSTEEISTGLEKFAAIADTVGLSYDYAAAALATVTATTRQSADTVGTAFRTLFGRLQDLELGETLEDGTDLGKYSKALATVGVQIKDVSGEMKDMDQILDDLGSRWDRLDKATQTALAQTVGGTRQYAQLIALMDNWDFFQQNLGVAQGSEGTLQEQADIYAESWEAARDRVKASAESIYQSIIDDKFFINMNNTIAEMLTGVGEFIKGLGGIKGLLIPISTLLMNIIGANAQKMWTNLGNNIKIILGQGSQIYAQMQTEMNNLITQKVSAGGFNDVQKAQLEGASAVMSARTKVSMQEKNMTQGEKLRADLDIQGVELAAQAYEDATRKKVAATEELKKAQEEEAKAEQQNENNTEKLTAAKKEQTEADQKLTNIIKSKNFYAVQGLRKESLDKSADILDSINTLRNEEQKFQKELESAQTEIKNKTKEIDIGKIKSSYNKEVGRRGSTQQEIDQLEEYAKKVQNLNLELQKFYSNTFSNGKTNATRDEIKNSGLNKEILNLVPSKKNFDQITEDNLDVEIGKLKALKVALGDLANGNDLEQQFNAIFKTRSVDDFKNKVLELREQLYLKSGNYEKIIDADFLKSLGVDTRDYEKSLKDLQEAQKNTQKAQEDLTKSQEKYNKAIEEAKNKNANDWRKDPEVKKALQEQKKAQEKLKQAEDAEQKSAENVRQKKEEVTKKSEEVTKATEEEVQAQKNLEKALAQVSNSYHKVNPAEFTMAIGSSLMSLTSVINSINSAITTLANPDASGWQKFSAVLSMVGMGMWQVTNFMRNYSKVMQGATQIQDAYNAKKLIAGQLELKEASAGATSVALKEASLELLGVENAEKLKQILLDEKLWLALKEHNVEEATKILQEQYDIAQTKVSNTLKFVTIAREKGLAVAIKTVTAARVKDNIAKKLEHPLLLGITIAIAAAIAATLILVNAKKKEREERAKNAESLKQELDATKEAADANKELVDSYEKALKTYKETGESKEELYNAALAVADAYEIENGAILVATENYEKLTAAIKEARLAELEKLQTDASLSMDAQGAVFKDISQKTKQGQNGGNTISFDNGSIFETGGLWADAWEKISKEYSDIDGLSFARPSGDFNIRADNLNDPLQAIAAYEAVKKMQEEVKKNANALGIDPYADDGYKNASKWLGEMAEQYKNLKDSQDALLASDFEIKFLGNIDKEKASFEDYKTFYDDYSKSLEDQGYSQEEANEKTYKLLKEQNDIVAEQIKARKKLIESNSNKEVGSWFDSLSDDEKNIVVANLELFDNGTTEDLQKMLEHLQELADRNTIIAKVELANTAYDEFKEGMSVSEAEDFFKQYFDEKTFEDYEERLRDFAIATDEDRVRMLIENQKELNAKRHELSLEELKAEKASWNEFTDNIFIKEDGSIVGVNDNYSSDNFTPEQQKYANDLTSKNYDYYNRIKEIEADIQRVNEIKDLLEAAKTAEGDDLEKILEDLKYYQNDSGYFLDNENKTIFGNFTLNEDKPEASIETLLQNWDSFFEATEDGTVVLKGQADGYNEAVEGANDYSEAQAGVAEHTKAATDAVEEYIEAEEDASRVRKNATNNINKNYGAATETIKKFSKAFEDVDMYDAKDAKSIDRMANSLGELIEAYPELADQIRKAEKELLEADSIEEQQEALEKLKEIITDGKIGQGFEELGKAASDLVQDFNDAKEAGDQFAMDNAFNSMLDQLGINMDVVSAMGYDTLSLINLITQAGSGSMDAIAQLQELMLSSLLGTADSALDGVIEVGHATEQILKIADENGFEKKTEVLKESKTYQIPVYTWQLMMDEKGQYHGGQVFSGYITKTYEAGSSVDILVPKKSTTSTASSGFKSGYRSGGAGKKSGSGGGGGGSSKKKSLDEEKERYHSVDRSIKAVTDELDKVKTATDRAYGTDKLQGMIQQQQLLTEQLELESQKLEEIGKYLDEDKKKLDQYGASYDQDGNIANYDELFTRQFAKYESGAWSDDDWEAFKKAIDQYEETLDLMQEETEKKADLTREYLDSKLEAIEYKVEVQIEADERDIKLIDYYLSKIEDKAFNAAESIALIGQKLDEFTSENDANLQGFKETLEQAGASAQDIEDILNGKIDANALAEKLNLTEKQKEDLDGYADSLLEINEALFEANQAVKDKLTEAFEEFEEELDDVIAKFDHFDSMLSSMRDIGEILNLSDSTMALIDQTQVDNAINKVAATQAKLKEIEDARDDAMQKLEQARAEGNQAAIDGFEESLKQIEESYAQTEEDLMSSWYDALQANLDAFQANVEKSLKVFGQAANVFKDLETLQDAREKDKNEKDRFLPDYEKAYRLSKLQRDLEKQMDELNDPASKAKLLEIQEKITEAQADGVQMSEYQMEYLQKQYDLKLAQIALEDKQNAKTKVRLRRDSEGNLGYVYTADEEKVDEAAQKYEDILFELQEMTDNYLNEMQDRVISDRIAMAQEIAALDRSLFDSEEEYEAAIKRISDYYMADIEFALNEIDLALGNNQELYEGDAGKYEDATGRKIDANKDLVLDFKDTFLSENSGSIGETIETTSKYYEDLATSWDNTVKYIKGYNDQYVLNNKAACDAAGYDMGQLSQTFGEKAKEIKTESDKVADSVQSIGEEAATAFGDALDGANDFWIKYQPLANSIISQNEAIAESWNKITQAIINQQLEEAKSREQQTSQQTPDTSQGSGSGSSGGSSGGSGGGGSGGSGKQEEPDVALSSTWKSSCSPTNDEYHTLNSWREVTWSKSGVKKDSQSSAKEKHSYTASFISGYIVLYCSKCRHSKTGSKHYSDVGSTTAQAALSAALAYYNSTGKMGSFATGGYTGDWGDSSGKLAVLHQKELVLNKEDTKNFLDSVNILRNITSTIDLHALSSSMGLRNISAAVIGQHSQDLVQHVEINASFPAVQDHNEIELALSNLINDAAQYVGRKN